MTNSLVTNNTLNGEIIEQVIDEKVSPQELQFIVENFPNTCFARIYNDIFERNSHIFRINSKWFFWDEVNEKIEDWNWKNDIEAIIQDCDEHDMERLNNSWNIVDENEYTEEYSDLISELNPNSETPVSIAINDLLSEFRKDRIVEHRILNILKKYSSKEEQAQAIIKEFKL